MGITDFLFALSGLELAGAHYDKKRGKRLRLLGQLPQIHREMATRWLSPVLFVIQCSYNRSMLSTPS